MFIQFFFFFWLNWSMDLKIKYCQLSIFPCLIFNKCKPLISASTDSSHSYTNSSIDLWLPFWCVCKGSSSPLLWAQCVVCAKNTAGFMLSRTDPFPFIYFGDTARYIFIPAKAMSRFFLHVYKRCCTKSIQIKKNEMPIRKVSISIYKIFFFNQ